MASYKALLEEEDRALLSELNITLTDDDDDDDEAADEVAGEDQQPEVARCAELSGSNNEQTNPPVV